MARDDYGVIIYQILSYLYNCLKKDIKVDKSYLEPQGKLYNINTNYWTFIIYNLVKDGYIEGVTLTNVWGEDYPIISDIENMRITPKGIEYLTDNSFIQKAKELLKDTNLVKKTLSILKLANDKGLRLGVNFSKVLTESILKM